MKTFTAILTVVLLAACGSDEEKQQSSAPTPSVRVASADLNAASPTADIGFNTCRLVTSVTEADARTPQSVTLGGANLTYRYDTQDGPFYLSEDKAKSLQVFNRQGFARVSISCPVE